MSTIEFLSLYMPSALLFCVLCVMLWKNNGNTASILRHYGNELADEKKLRVISQERFEEALSEKESAIHRLNDQVYSLASDLAAANFRVVSSRAEHPVQASNGDNGKEVVSRFVANSDMSAAEYPDGD